MHITEKVNLQELTDIRPAIIVQPGVKPYYCWVGFAPNSEIVIFNESGKRLQPNSNEWNGHIYRVEDEQRLSRATLGATSRNDFNEGDYQSFFREKAQALNDFIAHIGVNITRFPDQESRLNLFKLIVDTIDVTTLNFINQRNRDMLRNGQSSQPALREQISDLITDTIKLTQAKQAFLKDIKDNSEHKVLVDIKLGKNGKAELVITIPSIDKDSDKVDEDRKKMRGYFEKEGYEVEFSKDSNQLLIQAKHSVNSMNKILNKIQAPAPQATTAHTTKNKVANKQPESTNALNDTILRLQKEISKKDAIIAQLKAKVAQLTNLVSSLKETLSQTVAKLKSMGASPELKTEHSEKQITTASESRSYRR